MIATVLPDLRDRIGCTTAEMARAMSASDVTSAFSSVLVGLAVDRYRTKLDLLLAIALAIVTMTIIIKPLIPVYGVVFASYAVEGFGTTLLSVGRS